MESPRGMILIGLSVSVEAVDAKASTSPNRKMVRERQCDGLFLMPTKLRKSILGKPPLL
jgi:hypothetical protein